MTTNSDSTRRRFFWNAGAALSAPLAVGATSAAEADGHQEARAIHELDRQLARHVNSGAPGRAAGLFAEPDAIESLADVRRLAPADFGENDVLEIAPDGRSANAMLHCSVETATAIRAEGTLAEMARAQGEGFLRETRRRVLEVEYLRLGGDWKFRSLSFRDT
jgi:hypothetical protein